MSVIGNPLSCGRGYDDNLIASNIKKGVGIYDVVGTFEGWVPGDKEIYKYGAWGDGYSASNLVNCCNMGSYSSNSHFYLTYYSDYIDWDCYMISGNYSAWGYLGINKLMHFSTYNTLNIELASTGLSSGCQYCLGTSWNGSSYNNNIGPAGVTQLTSGNLYRGQTNTIDLSGVSQDGYIYFSGNGSNYIHIRRIYFT